MFKKFMKSDLGRGSLILMFLMTLGNLFSYIFQFSMARLLGPADYSILATITTLIAIFGIPTIAIQTIVTEKSARLNARNQKKEIKGILYSLTTKIVLISLVSFGVFALLSLFFLKKYLNISFDILILTGIFIFFAFISPIPAGVLQGLKNFKGVGVSFALNCLFKLLFGIFFVLLGWKVYGGVLGFILGALVAIIISLIYLEDILKLNKNDYEIKVFDKSNILGFVAMTIFVFMYTLDVFFARAIFTPEIAGQYAVVSMIGKIILFSSMVIGNVMLPINSERVVQGIKTRGVLQKSFLIVSLICGIALFCFILFPEVVINILFGKNYLEGAKILLPIGIAFSFLSLLNLSILNLIAKKKTTFLRILFLIGALIIQISGFLIVNQTIETFSYYFMVFSGIAFMASLEFLRH